MLWGGLSEGLELRREPDGATRLRGAFPYGKAAVLSDGGRTGRPRKEVIEAHAFRYRVETPSDHGGAKEIHLLSGHDFGRPLASVRSGTLSLTDTAQALIFVATITPAIAATGYGRDTLAQVESGLATGVSPGFRLPPKRAVADVEEVEQEPDDGKVSPLDGQPQRGAIIRRIKQALLYELSIVTRPSYPTAQVEIRNWRPSPIAPRVLSPRLRWRA